MKYSYVLLIFISSFIYGQPSYTDMLRSNLDASLYPQFVAVQSGAWHHGTTWEGGVVPSDNASVKIPNGVQVRISTELATRHKFIHVDGNLFISIHDNTLLKTETLSIGMMGYFRIGLPGNRVNPDKQTKIIFTSDDEPIDRAWDEQQITRGLMSMGKIRAYGKIKSHKFEFRQDITAGQFSITFNETIPADWEVGDELALPGTSFVRYQSFEDEVLKIAGITGNTIQLESPTQYDHIRLRDDQSLHLANLTRNVIFESESTDNPTQRRGHMMFMNTGDVEIEHAAMIGLGRTDKSEPLDEIIVDPENVVTPYPVGARNNVRGRYAVHFHKNGYGDDVNNAPSKILGCVVQNTQGWGFVNHSSHVHFEQNVCYDFVGSAFVTESGDELGNFYNNIAIKGTGNGEYRPVRTVFSNPERPQPLSDFAFSGDGFWFQGPAVRAVNNVAANCNGAGMFWFTMGSIEIDDNQMIGMNKDIALQAYAMHEGIENWNPRTWVHASNEVFTADLPILECSDFTGYANLAGFRMRMNNASVLSFFSADFGGGDVFGYIDQVEFAAGYDSPGAADRLYQDISDLELWNNEVGIRSRYTTNTNLNQVVVDNGLRYSARNAATGIASHHNVVNHFYDNTSVNNYGIGLYIYFKNTDINNPGTYPNSVDITNAGSDFHNMRDSTCMDPVSVEATDITNSSASINIANHSELQTMVVRYKSEEEPYWNYLSDDNANSIQLQGLNIDTEYVYQVLAGCEFRVSRWSEDQFFTTKCTNITGGYAIGSQWTYGTFTAPVCIGDNLRIRLATAKGSSIYTKPDGSLVNGNSNNTLFINPVALGDYGTYTVEYTDEVGCVSNYNFDVIPKSQKDGGYSVGAGWTYGTFTAPACIGDNLRIRLRTAKGASIYTKPNGEVVNGNTNNTLFINPVSDDDYGTYTVVYTDETGCAGKYNFNVIPKNQKDGGYSLGAEWIYGTFTAPVCIGDNLRLRLNTANGSSVYTKPDGSVVNGNGNNTLFINPVALDDYGTYTVVYTDETGCVSNYDFNVIPKSQKDGGYSVGSGWTYGTFTAPVCIGDNLRIRLRTAQGSSIYTKPNGEVVNGNTNNTLFINPVESQDFGTYTINYTDASGCEAVYYFSVVEDNSLCDGGSKIVDQNSGGFKLYPNPVSDKDVVFVSGVGIKHVEVFDVMGRQLNTQNFNTDESLVEINCSGFESGIYFARINGQYISKFIVQR